MNAVPSTWLDLLPKPAPIHGYVTIYRGGELDNEMELAEPVDERRICDACGDEHSLDMFVLYKFSGRLCRTCVNKHNRERYARNKRGMRLNLKGEK